MPGLPGWYHDPQGTAGHYRYWDGTTWSRETTTNPASPPPGQVVPGQAPPTPAAPGGTSAWPFVIGGGVLVVALVLGFLFMPGLLAPASSPSPTQNPPTTTSTDTTGPTSPPVTTAPLNCAGGNGVTVPKGTVYQSGGFKITVPANWTFRYSQTQWTWIDDAANWGTPADNSAGVSFGTLAGKNGFHTAQESTERVLECLTKYGWANDGYQQPVKVTSGEITNSGITGWRATYTIAPKAENPTYSAYEVVLISLPVQNAIVHLTAFYPTGDAAAKQQVTKVIKSLTK